MVYLTLPSDSSVEYFPQNTVAKYRVKLPKEYAFDGNYECGLVQFLYPVTWQNVPNSINSSVRVLITSSTTGRWMYKTPVLKVRPGHYRDIKSLLQEINKILEEYNIGMGCAFVYDAMTQKVKFHCEGDLELRIKLDAYLLDMLGFVSTATKWVRPNERGARIVDMKNGFNSIYIYSDLIQPVHVTGHTTEPLLRSVPVQGDHGDMALFQPTHILYFPLRSKQIQTVEVLLATDMGEPVPFKSGKSQITVHIRRTRPLDL